MFNFNKSILIKNAKRLLKNTVSIVYGNYFAIYWLFKRKSIYLNKCKRFEKIVVSLTSFPERISIVDKTIKSILLQKDVKPDRIELWLSYEQFPSKEESLPRKLIELKKYGVDICWCEDLKSYKKLIPSLVKNPDSIIVTCDDDVYYSNNWLKELFDEYKKSPNNVICHKATKFYFDNNQFKIISGGKDYYPTACFLNKLVGIGGVLYPPHCLFDDVVNIELFQSLAPTNDDIWFWFMAILKGTRVKVVSNNYPKPISIYEHKRSHKLSEINDNGECLFWEQFNKLIKKYPSVEKKLLEDSKVLN